MKNTITINEALAISPDYVAFVTGKYDKYSAIISAFDGLKKGQEAMTYHDGKFIRVKVSSIDFDGPDAVDGPVVRVSDGKHSWRVDGDKYAYPIKK